MLRGISALCMILGHASIAYPVDISGVPWCATMMHVIYTFHIELFFILSGWMYRCNSYSAFIQKTLRLLVPYFLFGTVFLTLCAFGGSLVNGCTSMADGIRKLFLHGGSYWFLYVLFLISGIYLLFARTLKDSKAKAAAAILVPLLNDFNDWPDTFKLTTIMNYLPYFIVGDLISKSCIMERLHTPSRKAALLTGGVAVYVLIHVLQVPADVQPEHFFVFVRAISFCAMLYTLRGLELPYPTS